MSAVGIDFGTTHGLVAVVRDGRPEVLADVSGDPFVPVAGAVAVKRRIGREAAAGSEASRVLGALRAEAESRLDGPVRRAVVAVPVHFDLGQRRSMAAAARAAGFDDVRLLADPAAAVLAEPGLRGTVAVFDLGAGRFDLSLVQVDEGWVEMLGSAGDPSVGGDELDRVFAELILRDSGLPGPADDVLLGVVRSAREALSNRLDTRVQAETPGGRVDRRVTRGLLEHAARPLAERCAAACRRALEATGLQPAQIDAVLLVGSATRAPAVQRFVSDFFEQRPRAETDPAWIVALGAAVHADRLSPRSTSSRGLVVEALGRGLGLELADGVVLPVLARGARLPASPEVQAPGAIYLVTTEDEPRRLARLGGTGPLRFLITPDGQVEATERGEPVALTWADEEAT